MPNELVVLLWVLLLVNFIVAMRVAYEKDECGMAVAWILINVAALFASGCVLLERLLR